MHCLRNEQCTCAYDLNNKSWPERQCKFDQVLDQTIKLLVKRLRTEEVSAGGLKAKALTQTVRDVGSSPAWHYIFLSKIHSKEKFHFLHIYKQIENI